MGNLVQIKVDNHSRSLTIKEFKGMRVVTLKEVDELHRRPEGTARRNFNENKKHFIEGEDFFVRNSHEAKMEFGISAPKGLVLLSESGYLMLVKSFTDDLAWEVQRQVVNGYFRAQVTKRDALQSLMQATHNLLSSQELIVERLDEVEQKLDEQITLNSVEQRRIQKAISSKVYEIESDPEARSELFRQLHREIKDRWQVPSYKDIRRQDLLSVINYINAWVPIRKAG